MLNILREVRIMRNEGKIHKKLLTQTRIMTFVALALGGIVAYEITIQSVHFTHAITFAFIGLVLGFYLFMPINAARWDEEQKIVVGKKIDRLGFAAIIAYIIIVVGVRIFLKENFASELTMLVLSLVFGMLLGRVIGTIVEIHRAFRAAHT